MQTYRRLLALLALVLATNAVRADTFGTGANQFSIDFVPISGATNPTDTSLSRGYGIVNNDFRMGTFEITNDQWNKFAAAYGPVTGSNDGYEFGVYYTGANVPTNRVSWYEAAQFVNWLNTSTGHQAAYKFTGTRGTSNYTFATWSPAEAAGGTNLYRHKDAYYFLPTEDEWVKAAYWNGTAIQTYANASAADLVSGVPDPAKWYYDSPGNAPWNVATGVEELNGTYDMMGNIFEWMESPFSGPNFGAGSSRALRGGSFGNNSYTLSASDRSYYFRPTDEYSHLGFRVASVPEPGCITLLAAALAGLICWKLRR